MNTQRTQITVVMSKAYLQVVKQRLNTNTLCIEYPSERTQTHKVSEYKYFKSQTRVSDYLVLISVMQKLYLSKNHQCNLGIRTRVSRVRVQCSTITLTFLLSIRLEISMNTQRTQITEVMSIILLMELSPNFENILFS